MVINRSLNPPLSDNSELIIDLRALGNHETELTLTHEGFPEIEIRDRHIEGWEGCLAKLPDVF